MKTVIAAIQMEIKTNEVETNLIKAETLIQKAAKYRPKFIVLPEMWATGFAFEDLDQLSRTKLNLILEFLTKLSKQHKAYIVGGSVPEPGLEKVCNTCFVFNPKGELIGKQLKLNPFPLTGEDKYFEAGKTLAALNTEVGSIGIVICYDLRFPNISEKLAKKGAQLLFMPAQWPAEREEHWKILLKARAIENQTFVIGANGTGGKGFPLCGKSTIISPWGEIEEEAGTKETVLVGEIDLSKISKAKEKLPTKQLTINNEQ